MHGGPIGIQFGNPLRHETRQLTKCPGSQIELAGSLSQLSARIKNCGVLSKFV